MEHPGFVLYKTDIEVWMHKARKETYKYYCKYVLLYVDDVLCISFPGKKLILKLT